MIFFQTFIYFQYFLNLPNLIIETLLENYSTLVEACAYDKAVVIYLNITLIIFNLILYQNGFSCFVISSNIGIFLSSIHHLKTILTFETLYFQTNLHLRFSRVEVDNQFEKHRQFSNIFRIYICHKLRKNQAEQINLFKPAINNTKIKCINI